MATTIPQSFSTFKSNLEITDLQTDTISTRHKNVRDAVKNKLDVLDSFLTGSYSRSTMIAPLKQADIDIFAVLSDTSYYKKDGQAALLDKVKDVLKGKYPTTSSISRNGQAVTISFSDFNVDVVPAFNRTGGGYVIPNTITSSWISTNPKEHITITSEANKQHNNMLVPLVKMIKCWNKECNYHFGSFHLEVMAMQIFEKNKINDFSSALHCFFDKGRNYVTKKNPDPAGYNDDVGSYINSQVKIDNAVSRFTTAYNRAEKAVIYAADNKPSLAVEEWQKIFGSQFPTFG